MRFVLTLFILSVFVSFSSAQVLIIPSDISIKKPKNPLLAIDIQLTPLYSQFFGGKIYHEEIKYFSNTITDEMNSWFDREFTNVKIYEPSAQVVDLNKFKGAILRETQVYDIYKSKPLFGYGANAPTEGANTKEYLEILRKEYQASYVVYIFAVSLYTNLESAEIHPTSEVPEYRGFSYFYGIILDTKTGHIENISIVKDKTYPIYKDVNQKYITKRCKKLQRKMKNKINRLI